MRNFTKNLMLRLGKKTRLLFPTQRFDSSYWNDWSSKVKLEYDSQTIWEKPEPLRAAYHYSSLEMAVEKALWTSRKRTAERILDIGAGTGHWTQFFRQTFGLSIEVIRACDIDEQCCEVSRRRFARDSRITVHHCAAHEFPQDSYDLICMLGCAFHITADDVLLQTLRRLFDSLSPGGVIVLNDLLPIVSYFNQRAKKVRSRMLWRRLAKAAGLRASFFMNFAWMFAPGPIPEGHIVLLRKRQ